MTLVDTLELWGVQLPGDVVELAAAAGLPLNIAAALLDQESGGGRNVWGNDGVNTGGIYTKGAPVDRNSYLAYKARRAELGNQGVGPCQLTASGYQDQADALGGCWIPRNNMLVGFRALADLIRRFGTADGIRRYNGSGPMADAYREQVLARAAAWAARLGQGSTLATSPTVLIKPTQRVDDLMGAMTINLNPALKFHEAIGAEAGGGSAVASSGWVTWGSTYGGTTFTIAALGGDGTVLGYWKDVRVTNNQQTSRQLPDGTRCVTAEGAADNEGTRPWVSVWSLR